MIASIQEQTKKLDKDPDRMIIHKFNSEILKKLNSELVDAIFELVSELNVINSGYGEKKRLKEVNPIIYENSVGYIIDVNFIFDNGGFKSIPLEKGMFLLLDMKLKEIIYCYFTESCRIYPENIVEYTDNYLFIYAKLMYEV